MHFSGLVDYFSEFWNKIDSLLFILYLAYFCIRWSHADTHQLPDEHQTNTSDQWSLFYIVINSFILVAAILKTMFFARINEVFGQLVNLIAEVIKSIRFFLFFFVSWIFIFSWLYRIAGVELNDI